MPVVRCCQMLSVMPGVWYYLPFGWAQCQMFDASCQWCQMFDLSGVIEALNEGGRNISWCCQLPMMPDVWWKLVSSHGLSVQQCQSIVLASVSESLLCWKKKCHRFNLHLLAVFLFMLSCSPRSCHLSSVNWLITELSGFQALSLQGLLALPSGLDFKDIDRVFLHSCLYTT